MCRDSGETHRAHWAHLGAHRVDLRLRRLLSIEVAGKAGMLDTRAPARTGAGIAPTPVAIGHGGGGRQPHHIGVDQGL